MRSALSAIVSGWQAAERWICTARGSYRDVTAVPTICARHVYRKRAEVRRSWRRRSTPSESGDGMTGLFVIVRPEIEYMRAHKAPGQVCASVPSELRTI